MALLTTPAMGDLVIVGRYDTPDIAWDVYISGGYAYVADFHSGLQVIDVYDPTNPILAGSCDTPGEAWGVYVSGGYAYIADGPSGLQVIDVSDPANPILAGSCDIQGWAFNVYVSGGYAYVADQGLTVIDVSDPANPIFVERFDTPGEAVDVYVSGGYAYVADVGGIGDLAVIDVSDPANPILAGSCATPGWANGVYVSGGYAYVADQGLTVIDVSDPTNPILAGSYSTPGSAERVYVSGGYAYVTDHFGVLQVIDVSDPTNPSLAGSCATQDYAEGVYVSGSYAYIANGFSGLSIIGRSGVEVTKTADPSFGSPGTNVTFNLTVTNEENAPLPHVFVSDVLPEGMSYVSSSSGGMNNGRYVNWSDIGPLAPGAEKKLWVVAQIDGPVSGVTTLTNRVDVEAKPEHGDNVTANATATVTAKEASISMEMTADPELAALFSEVTFTINVTNTGQMVLDPVVLIDELPAGMTFVSADPLPDGIGSLRWDDVGPGSLDPGESATINLTAKVDGDAKSPLVNQASATGCPEHGCNVSCCCSAEVQLPGLNVTKTADKTEYDRGDEITYTIVVENLADVPVYDVVVRDVFNRGVEFVHADPAPNANGIWRFDVIPAGGSVTITLVVRVPDQDFEFDMVTSVSVEGFVNVADDYSTTLQPYSITNRVYVTSASTYGEFSDSETVSVLEDPGTELETREHGSGSYDGDELVQMRTENKSISMDKDVAATYAPTTLGLYRNRTVAFSSMWTESAQAKNRVTGASMSEQYRYATSIDRDSRFFLDENESVMDVNSEFDGMGHIGFLKMPTDTSSCQTAPLFEGREDYTGSFKVLEQIDEYGSAVNYEKAVSGSGLAVVDKRIGDSQRSYESGTGSYDSEEVIETYTNYIAKDISLVHGPASQSLTDDISIDSAMKWKEGMYSKVQNTSLIGEEYTSITSLDKETVAKGLNEMDTDVNFSGRARYRSILRDEVDFDEQYEGDYSIERRVIFTGVAKYDRPHLNVTKTLDGAIVEEALPWGYNETHLAGETKTRKVANYVISIENDGNKALGPVYVQDLFPLGSAYIEASLRPSELADTYANWTLMNIGIGDRVVVRLKLDVTKYHPSELVNRVEVCGGINNGEDWICVSNFSAIEIKWLTCCQNETVSVTKTAELDSVDQSVVRYRVEIKNDDDVTRVATVTDYLPEGMELVESSIPFASYDGDVVVWNLVEIPASGTAAIEFSALAPGEGWFANTVEVDARSVDGPVVQPVRATCVIDVGEVEDECGPVSCEAWQPPNWEFEHYGYESAKIACEDLTCTSCDGTGSCLAP